jgi:tetratricopeptide (TPR) repeat protein
MFTREITSKKSFIAAALAVTCFLTLFPVKTLLSDWYSGRAAGLLDDPSTPGSDVIGISARTMQRYRSAAEALEKAAALEPSDPRYQKALSDLYVRLGAWADAMERMNETLPAGAFAPADAFERAGRHLERAIDLEPSHAEYHLARGGLYQSRGDPAAADREYAAAIAAWPVNAELRHDVAMRYLLGNDRAKALEHARVLAAIDRSYLASGSGRAGAAAARHDAWYVARLSNSYLFKAFEIAWRASGGNIETIREMAPRNPDAQAAEDLFFESKGIEE